MAGKGIVIQIQGDGTGAAEALRMIEEKMRETAATGNEMSEQLQVASERMQKALEYAGISYGMHEAIDGMKEMVQKSVDLGMEIGHLSKQTGISTENLSVLKYVSEQTGVSFESLQKGFKKLSTEMFEVQMGSKEANAAFGLLHISSADLTKTNGDMYKTLELVADKMAAMPDGWQKSAAAQQLFGRAGVELIPILDQGADALERMRGDAEAAGVVLSDSMVKQMEELHKLSTQVESNLMGLAIELTRDLTPAITNWSQGMEIALGYLRDWLNLSQTPINVGLAAIPKSILQSSDPATLAYDSGQERSKIDSQIAALNQAHDAKLVSEQEFQQKMLKLHQDYDKATEQEAAAHATSLWKQVSVVQAQLEDMQRQHAAGAQFTATGAEVSGTPDLDAQIVRTQKQLDEMKALEAHYLDEMRAAQDRMASNTATGSPGMPDSLSKDNTAAIKDANWADSVNRLMDEQTAKEYAKLSASMAAELHLREANDARQLAEAKDAMEIQMAFLDAKHTEGLVKERDYLAQKLQIEESGYAAEKQALVAKQQQLQSAVASQHDETKQNELKAQLVDVETKLANLAAQREKSEAAITAEIEKQRNIPSGGTSAEGAAQQAEMASRASEAQATAQITGRFLEQLSNLHGKDPLRALVQDMIADLDRLATEVLEKQFILPMLRQLFAPGVPSVMGGTNDPLGLDVPGMDLSGLASQLPQFPTMATGGSPDGATWIGEHGMELWTPPAKGGTVTPSDVLEGLAKGGGGGGGAPNVTMNLVNQSSQPLQSKPPSVSYDAQARQFIVHTVIEDMQQGGPVSMALRGIGG